MEPPGPGAGRRRTGLGSGSVDDLAHARTLCDRLGPTFCLTYVKGADAPEALRRLGDAPGLRAVDAGAWSVVLEAGGSATSDDDLICAASRGAEVVSLLRHDPAHFAYAVDGVMVTAFDPAYPAEETVWGSDPELLRPLMTALELRTPVDETDQAWQDAPARAVVLAQRVTGVRVPLDIPPCDGATVVP